MMGYDMRCVNMIYDEDDKRGERHHVYTGEKGDRKMWRAWEENFFFIELRENKVMLP